MWIRGVLRGKIFINVIPELDFVRNFKLVLFPGLFSRGETKSVLLFLRWIFFTDQHVAMVAKGYLINGSAFIVIVVMKSVFVLKGTVVISQ